MQSISFQLRSGDYPFVVDFEKFDISVLRSINRILDIECYDDILIIQVNVDLYKQIGEWLLNNTWWQHIHNDDQYDLKVDGHEIIITKEE